MQRAVQVLLVLVAISVVCEAQAPATLNLNGGGWVQGKGQDFLTTGGFDTSVWTNVFDSDGGYHFWFSEEADTGLLIGSEASESWPQAGFMQVRELNKIIFIILKFDSIFLLLSLLPIEFVCNFYQ
jgi:hypothetical protein